MKSQANRASSTSLGRTRSQHYTAFTVEFLLSARKRVRRTKITYVPTGESESWPGWDAERLTDRFIKQADLRPPSPPTPATDIQLARESTPRPGHLQLTDLTVLCGDVPGGQLAAGAEYDVKVRLSASGFKDPSLQSLTYLLVVFARELSSGARRVAAATSGWLAEGEHEIKIAGRALPPGLYRLEAVVDLVGRAAGPESWLEGDLLQVW